jgi:hypothetical protein
MDLVQESNCMVERERERERHAAVAIGASEIWSSGTVIARLFH